MTTPKTSAEGPVMELRGVSRSWLGREPVFSDLDLSVETSRITVLLGPSGCGKSTLLRCAASLDAPQSGDVLIGGRPVTEPSPDRQLILQDDNQLLPWLTVENNIAFPMEVCGCGGTEGCTGRERRRERRRRDRRNSGMKSAANLLDRVGLPDAGGLYPAQLSGGMRQRVVLARSLAADPAILLLDEPFAALDNAIRSRLQVLLREINRSAGITMLLVTHDIAEALVLADRIVFMDAGGKLGIPEDNPLGDARDPDSLEFFRAIRRMRGRYGTLLDSEYPDAP